VIKTFRCRDTEALFKGGDVKRFRGIAKAARRKLDYLDAAKKLEDLKAPPGNMLKALWGDREGQYGIRVNDQWRVCFEWHDGAAYNVEIVDCH
jgi:proteic killer suppression protein